jgi:hypothetical protein
VTKPGKEPLPYRFDGRPSKRAGAGFLLAMLALLLGAILLLNSGVLETSYSGVAFMGIIPFAIGALITGAGLQIYSHYGCILAPVLIFAVLFPLMHFSGAEGLICILMVLPFWLSAGLGGGLAAWVIHRRLLRRGEMEGAGRVQVVGLLALPLALLYAEETSPPDWQERSVVRSVDVAAAPEVVWPLLLAIPHVRPDEGLPTFTHDIAGIPRPSEARLVQQDGRLVRLGQWGDAIRFEERVKRLVPGRAIGWDFAFPDTSVQDYTDRHISPDGPMLKIAHGGYALTPLAGGKVRVELATTYRMRSRLGWYAGLWGEVMLGEIHDNVLAIIKTRAEAGISRP